MYDKLRDLEKEIYEIRVKMVDCLEDEDSGMDEMIALGCKQAEIQREQQKITCRLMLEEFPDEELEDK